MTQIIIKNLFIFTVQKNSTGPEAASYVFFFQFVFSVTRDPIDHFGEEIVWLPSFSD